MNTGRHINCDESRRLMRIRAMLPEPGEMDCFGALVQAVARALKADQDSEWAPLLGGRPRQSTENEPPIRCCCCPFGSRGVRNPEAGCAKKVRP